MTTPKDGGPASEMTVRQEYKKAAIAGLCAHPTWNMDAVAPAASAIADAAIAEDAEFAERGAPPTTGG